MWFHAPWALHCILHGIYSCIFILQQHKAYEKGQKPSEITSLVYHPIGFSDVASIINIFGFYRVEMITLRQIRNLFLDFSLSIHSYHVDDERKVHATSCSLLIFYSYKSAEQYAESIAKKWTFYGGHLNHSKPALLLQWYSSAAAHCRGNKKEAMIKNGRNCLLVMKRMERMNFFWNADFDKRKKRFQDFFGE